MAIQKVNVGNAVNDGTGDPARTAFTKLNVNDQEIYNFLGNGTAVNVLPAALPIAKGGTGATDTDTARNNLGITQAISNINNTILGVGQTVQNVTSSRAFNVTYTNTTSKPIFVYVTATAGSALSRFILYVNGNATSIASANNDITPTMYAVVPPNATYYFENTYSAGTAGTITLWHELR